VLPPSDTNRKVITCIAAVSLPFVTYLLAPSRKNKTRWLENPCRISKRFLCWFE
jgi:hypothetical protein